MQSVKVTPAIIVFRMRNAEITGRVQNLAPPDARGFSGYQSSAANFKLLTMSLSRHAHDKDANNFARTVKCQKNWINKAAQLTLAI